ncbi:NAD(P)H-dependent flavin oxidoreductase [Chiayiivirga flava]|uniref:Propionate 3-nitronate monooxygenase n=1 Tax=Chiayiivirga flava TaxID=659595 RepID=A0A7W8D2P9_9GAMM|nr:nitronate monooxygenase [Chiayiivirga flava]MBB5206878.1 nitronate monooxygenase [Chiayiivirga flava]
MPSLTAMLGLALPIVQAPMAGVQDTTLAIAVASAGGLGSVPCALLDLAQLDATLARLADAGCAANLNFFCHAMPEPDADRERRWRDVLAPYRAEFALAASAAAGVGLRRPIDDAVVDVLASHRPRVVSFHFGLPPERLLRRIRAWGTCVLATATTVDEGRWLERHGADVVIAQGVEAGGHRGHFLAPDPGGLSPTRDLVVALRAALGCTVVAAGGIATRADVESMLSAGADAVQAGTAYLLCAEATTPAVHRAALARAATAGTAITNLFTGRPARGIVNRLMHELPLLSDLPPPFPWASQALAPLRARAEALGRDDFSAVWCGTRGDACRPIGAAALTRSLAGVAPAAASV